MSDHAPARPAPAEVEVEPSIGELITSAQKDFSALVKQEIALLKSEVSVSVKLGGMSIALFAAAGFLALMAVILLSLFFVYLVHLTGLGLVWSYLVVVLLYLALAGVLGFVGSLIIYLLYKDRGPFVRAHAANSLNIQITTGIGVVISFVLMFVLIGFVTIFVVGIWALVMHIIGAVKANNGEWWDPPLVPKFVR